MSCDFSFTAPTSSPIGAFTTSAPTTTTSAANSPETWGPNLQVLGYIKDTSGFSWIVSCFECLFIYIIRKPGIFREAPLASCLVPERGRPLPKSTEGTGKGGLLVPEEAGQTEVGPLESSSLSVRPLVLFCCLLFLGLLRYNLKI